MFSGFNIYLCFCYLIVIIVVVDIVGWLKLLDRLFGILKFFKVWEWFFERL